MIKYTIRYSFANLLMFLSVSCIAQTGNNSQYEAKNQVAFHEKSELVSHSATEHTSITQSSTAELRYYSGTKNTTIQGADKALDILSFRERFAKKTNEPGARGGDVYNSRRGDLTSIGNGHIIALSVGFLFPTGNAPYTYGTQYALDFGTKLQPKKIGVLFTIGASAYADGRKKWIQEMVGSSHNITSFDGGWALDAMVRVPIWLNNTGYTAFGIAPMAGYKKLFMAKPDGFSDDLKLPNIAGPVFGIEGTFAMRVATIYVGYNWYKVTNSALAPGAPPFVVDMSGISIKLSYGRWKK